MFWAVIWLIFVLIMVFLIGSLTDYGKDTCPRCSKKSDMKIVYPDPNNAEEVKQAKVMRKRCEVCGYVIEIPCDFREDGKIGQGLYKCTGKFLKMIGKW